MNKPTTYTIRCKECRIEQTVFLTWEQVQDKDCFCGGFTEVVIRRCPPVSIRHGMRESTLTNGDYREDLARFPNDPEAFVDGPTALKKLIEKRKRQGIDYQPVSNAAPAVEDENPAPRKSLIAEAYEEAKASNFNPDED